METIYENTCVDTQEEYRQMFAWLYGSFRIWLAAFELAAGVILFLTGVMEPNTILLIYSCLLLWLGIRQMCLAKILSKKHFRKKVAVYSGDLPPKTYLFYEDHFRVYDVDSDTQVPYSRVRRVGMLKDCYALSIEPAGAVYTISRNGFTKGDADHFYSFLQEKCPKSKFSVKV